MTLMSTQHPYAVWLDLAFDQTDAARANEALAFHRDAREELGLLTRSYEVVVPDPAPPLRAFLDQAVTRFSRHLEALHVSPKGAEGVFLSVFVADRLYFIGSRETLALYGSLRSKDPPAGLLPG